MKMILFDIDGTLLYTGGAGRIAFESAFEEIFGLKDVWQDLIPDGKTDPMIVDEITARTLKRKLRQDEYQQLVDLYHQHFKIQIQNPPKFHLLPGVTQLLDVLSRETDCLLGIATGNFEVAAREKLKRGRLQDFFRFGGFASDAASRVELTRIGLERGQKLVNKKLSPENIYLVGDTPHDVAVGKALGVQMIAVATGRTSVEEFQSRYQPEYALQDLSDTDQFLDILNG